MQFWYDGQEQTGDRLALALTDPGLLYGATVFTTLRVYERSLTHPLTHWQDHCDRLLSSLQAFGWANPDWQRVRAGAEFLAQHYPVVRITIFPDGREWITGRALPSDLDQRQQMGIRGWVANEPDYRRSLPQHKTGNYLGAWLALQKAQTWGAQEAILVDSTGHWLETTTGNLWGWREGIWYTPKLEDNFLPGILRSQLISWLRQQHIPWEETLWTPEFVSTLSLIAYSNSVVEIVPFREIIFAENNQIVYANSTVLDQIKPYFRH